ncbi:MAG: hypothetical protein CM15mP59_2710 [Flavobacteriaceae bacterium]|nr:MAG: hypothetical protein CM15mP59_2710 [Flavobacteriaceae bacterium]
MRTIKTMESITFSSTRLALKSVDTTSTDFQLPVKITIDDFRRSTFQMALFLNLTNKPISACKVYTTRGKAGHSLIMIALDFWIEKKRFNKKVCQKQFKYDLVIYISDCTETRQLLNSIRLGIFQIP